VASSTASSTRRSTTTRCRGARLRARARGRRRSGTSCAGYDVVLHGAIANLCALHERLGHSFPARARGGATSAARWGGASCSRAQHAQDGHGAGARAPARVQCSPVGAAPGRVQHVPRLRPRRCRSATARDFEELVRTSRESGAASSVDGARPGLVRRVCSEPRVRRRAPRRASSRECGGGAPGGHRAATRTRAPAGGRRHGPHAMRRRARRPAAG
jgi:hypothetical protein